MAERPPVDDQVAPLRGLGRFPRETSGALRRVSDPSFPVGMRGYDRHSVDAYVEAVSRIVAELEARQSSEAVIKRALEEVGEQTSSILQKAHETAEDVTHRSRAQADDRIQEAEREAARVRREADEWLRGIQTEVETLFAERRRVIEDMRLLAEELLGVADAGLERLEADEAALVAASTDETVAMEHVEVEPEPEALEVGEAAVVEEDEHAEDEPAEDEHADDEPPPEGPEKSAQ